MIICVGFKKKHKHVQVIYLVLNIRLKTVKVGRVALWYHLQFLFIYKVVRFKTFCLSNKDV